MEWLDLINGADAIRKIFDGVTPKLSGIRVHEITFHQDGPTILLRLDLTEFPQPPPKKWLDAGHNTVQVILSLDDVAAVKLDGWSTNNVGELTIARQQPSGLRVEFASNARRLSVLCAFASIGGVSAHHSTARGE